MQATSNPVLLIHGDQDYHITKANEYMEKTIPGSRRVLLKDVAHMLNMEKGSEVNNLITGFFEK
jgi:pimeloyl-ACP methyl ester carboxylesterase